MSMIKDSKHLRIPFEDIKTGTQNFTTLIGRGGYGHVYRGNLSLYGVLTIVAVKRLQINNLSGQGLKEFLTEIQLLSRYKHQNLVSLVGFCEERDEKFLIYEYAEHGSLDNYLYPTKNRCPFTWKQRIIICIDAARGLDHLHNHVAQNERVIHRDIKSGNILLDYSYKAMIADFGLSKIGRVNENDTYLITNASGTHGYCDPAYIQTGILTKESDIYSFGVVLFEVLCGRLCFINVNSKERFLAPLAKRYYAQDKLNIIVDRGLKNYMNSDSMKVFSDIAFQCLHDERKQRPLMGLVLEKLEKVLKLLEIEEACELLELEDVLDLQKLVKTMQMQQFEENAHEVQELEEALGLVKLVETLQKQQFQDVCEMQKLEEALGLHKLVETLQMQQFQEACEIQELEEALGLHKLVENLQMQQFEESCKMHEFEQAMELQKLMETLQRHIGESRVDYEVIKAIYDMRNTPLLYISRDKIYSHLSSGILVDEGKVWFSIDDDGNTEEMISAMKVLPLNGERYSIRSVPASRFSKIAEVSVPYHALHVQISTQFLSSNVTYATYLVCKPNSWSRPLRVEEYALYNLNYTLNYTSETYISYLRKIDDNGWWMFELFQTLSFKRSLDFEATFRALNTPFMGMSFLWFEGIRFLPIQKLEDEDETEKSEEKNPATLNIEWDNKLPIDYQQFLCYSSKKMMVKSQRDVIFPTKEEAYSILSSGVLIKVNYEVNMWFWITKSTGKKCFMLPPTLLSSDKQLSKITHIPSKESRIEKVLHLSPSKVSIGMLFKVPHGVLSTNTTYGCYLVYKMPQGFGCEAMVKMKCGDGRVFLTCLSIPQSPVIGPQGVRKSFAPINDLKTIQLPRKRKDGWLEVNLGSKSDTQWTNMQQDELFDYNHIRESTKKYWFLQCCSNDESDNIADEDTHDGFNFNSDYFSNIIVYMWPLHHPIATPQLIVQGIEFRPI